MTSAGYNSLQLANLKRKAQKQDSQYDRFKRQYYNDWVALIHDCIDWQTDQRPTPYQIEVISQLQTGKRVAVRGPHGLGKTALASWTLLAFALTRDGLDWKAPTTASAWRQLTKYLWPELHKWARRLKWEKIGREPFNTRLELQSLNLKLGTGEAFAVASDQPELIEGAHADHLLYIFDESKAIPDAVFDSAEGAFSGTGEIFALAISTPGEPIGRFYDIHRRKPGYEEWWVRHVTADEAIKAGRLDAEWVENRKRQWGESSAVYQNRVAGEFAASDEDSVIPLAWIELANQRWQELTESGEWGQFTSVGVDIGGGGEYSDKTVEALVFDRWKVKELRKFPRGDVDTATMQEAGRTKGILDAYGGKAILDGTGLGAGSYHRLREQGYENAYSFVAAQTAERNGERLRDRTNEFEFTNKRSAAWWFIRELLDPVDGEPIALPPDDELTGELTTPKKRITSGAKIQVESKDDIKKRLNGRSTDSADAVIQGIVGPELIDEVSEIGVFVVGDYQ
jgi:hypothetical protein